jgi:Cu(I)/Ag(I) efflux system membrane fusion protein
LPRNAIVNLGEKQVVFLKKENHFIAKTVQIGIITDSLVQITNGLSGDEQVALNAQYLVDSESFIQTNDNK